MALGECVTFTFLSSNAYLDLNNQVESFPFQLQTAAMLEPSNVQTKGENPCGYLPQKNLHPAFPKNAGRKSPTELGMCQGWYSASVLQKLFPRHSQRLWGSMTGGQICSGWRNSLTGKKQTQPFGMLYWAFVYLPLWYFSLAVNFIYQCKVGEKWLLFFDKPQESSTGKNPLKHFGFPSPQLSATQQLHILTMTCWRDNDRKSQSVTQGEALARYSRR